VIVDTHVHVIAADQQRYPLQPADFAGQWYAECPVTIEEFVATMDAAGVDRTGLVQPSGAYGTDNRYVVDAATAYSHRCTAVVTVDPTQPDAIDDLTVLAAHTAVTGVRHFAIHAPLDDPRAVRLWETAADCGLRVVVATLAGQVATLHHLLDHFASVPVALDHCGFVDLNGEARELFALAAHPNLHLKVSSIVLESAVDPRAAMRQLVTHFGAHRLMWGSDYSQTHDRPYAQLVAMAVDACDALAPEQREQILGSTALALWPELA